MAFLKAEFKSNERSFKVIATIVKTLNMKPHDKFKKSFEPLETSSVYYNLKVGSFVLVQHYIYIIFALSLLMF